ncbi:MAG: hemolysin family protein [candidate division WOR-3 bacterium]
MRMFGRRIKGTEDIERLLAEATKRGILSSHMQELLVSILEAKETTVEEIMVPRVDAETARASQTLREVVEEYKEHGYSKIPVLTDEGEEVVGVLHIKEVIKFLDKLDEMRAGDLAIKPLFVPHAQLALDTLRLFQREKASIALVVDEYGSLVGLVTTEDILEEIVGDIWEEYDREEFTYRTLPDGSWLISARLDLEEASEIIGMNLSSEEALSLGGFVIERLGHVPKKGEKVELENLRIEVVDATPQRVKLLKVTKTS